MALVNVFVGGFRCLEKVSLDLRAPDGSPIRYAAIVGPNGSGKSSLLDAIGCAAVVGGYSAAAPGLESTSRVTLRFASGAVMDVERGNPHPSSVGGADRSVLQHTLFVPAWRDPKATLRQPIAPGGQRVDGPAWIDPTHAVSGRMPAVHQWMLKEQLNRSLDRLWKASEAFLGKLRWTRIDPDTHDFRFEAGTAEVGLNDLSSGQRSIVIFFAELLMRCDPDGLVLIDEPEAHMHPRWQRQLRPALLGLLPEAQFIVATHSPYIVEGLEPHQVFSFGELD